MVQSWNYIVTSTSLPHVRDGSWNLGSNDARDIKESTNLAMIDRPCCMSYRASHFCSFPKKGTGYLVV
jgi:hypothetical protein